MALHQFQESESPCGISVHLISMIQAYELKTWELGPWTFWVTHERPDLKSCKI